MEVCRSLYSSHALILRSSHNPLLTTTKAALPAPAPAPAPTPASAPAITADPTPSSSQIPPSTTLAEAKNVDLNPSSTDNPAPATTAGTTEKRTETGGMSATSGPLDDGIAHGFGGEEAEEEAGAGAGRTAVEREGGA